MSGFQQFSSLFVIIDPTDYLLFIANNATTEVKFRFGVIYGLIYAELIFINKKNNYEKINFFL